MYKDLFENYGDHLTVKELAKYLGVCDNTVYKLLRTRRIKGRRVGTDWRITRENVMKLLDNKY